MTKLPDYKRLDAVTARDIVLDLEVVTPLYGGGARARMVDRDLPVRASGIRGQLRFWWRCLYGPRYASAAAMYEAERALWGGLAKEHRDLRASSVVLYVRKCASERSAIDHSTREPGDPDGYALWTVKGGAGVAPAERWMQGRRFMLVVRPPAPTPNDRHPEEVRNTLRAWILFGGVGGRVRRGLGALALTKASQRADWLPPQMDAASLRDWLSPLKDHPTRAHARLADAMIAWGGIEQKAVDAWHVALGWLRDFRQKHGAPVDVAPVGATARQRPDATNRAGRSRWPEADKLRIHKNQRDHTVFTEHANRAMHWPRAEFGLPLQFRFQTLDRKRYPYATLPPGSYVDHDGRVKVGTFKLGWSLTTGGQPLTRLASPLIVKPVQLPDGTFAPLALWLARELPKAAQVGVDERGALVATAPFGLTPPHPDKHLFTALSNKGSLRAAFMDWLRNPDNTSPARGTL